VTRLEEVEVAEVAVKEAAQEAVKEEVKEAAKEEVDEVVKEEVDKAAKEAADEAVKEVAAMQDLECKCSVGPGNMTTLTVSSFWVVSSSPL
jgi:hypothetical protein